MEEEEEMKAILREAFGDSSSDRDGEPDFLSADQQSSLLSALRKDGYLAEASHNQVVEDRVQLLQELEELDITEKSAASLGKPKQSWNAYIASAESALTNPCTLATFLCFSSSN
ncbi:hypothetical protein C2S52_005477 [Perilla frutescens var. hirtella]|nr:hypothetical protein C2S52_005477 [Perilla frutescens var. hirtella]